MVVKKKRENTSLKSETKITFRSHQIINMVKGRKKAAGVEPITGLITFGGLVRQVFQQAKADNPYADFYLLMCEERIQAVREFIQRETVEIDAKLMSNKFLQFNEVHVDDPFILDASFATPYAYQVAYLMLAADDLICKLLQATHVAMIPKSESGDKIRGVSKRLRGLFASFNSWKLVVVTRDDMKLGNKRAERAIETFGSMKLPEAVLSGELRGDYAPDIKVNETEVVTVSATEEAVVV